MRSPDGSAPGARCARWLVALCVCAALGACDDDAAAGHDAATDAAPRADAGDARDAGEQADAAGARSERDSAVGDGAAPVDAMPAGSDAGARDAQPNEDASPDDAAATSTTPRTPRDRRSLVDQYAWKPLAAAADPFDDRPEDVACDAVAYGAEQFSTEIAYSIDTARCAYLTVEQPALDEVRAGEDVRVRVWHFELSGPDGAEAHVALTLDGHALLDERVPIPAAGALLSARWLATETIAAGAKVRLHVHNHGANQYAFLELSTGAAE